MKKWMLMILAAAITAALLSGCGGGGGPSPSGSTLSGKVVDGVTAAAISGARVTFGSKSTTTGTDGTFSLTGLTLGTDTLTVQKTNYEIYTASVQIRSGANTLPSDVRMSTVTGDPPVDSPRTVEGTITLTGASNSTGVVVTLIDDSTSQTYDQMTTGSDGKYYFWAPRGTYTVRAAMSGYTTREQHVTVSDLSQVVSLNLTLVQP